VREYPEQTELLAKVGPGTGAVVRARSPRLGIWRQELESSVQEARVKTIEIEELKVKLEQLGRFRGIRFATRVPTEYLSTELQRLVGERNQAEIQKAVLNPDLGPEHPEVKRVEARIRLLDHQLDEQQESIMDRFRTDADERNRRRNSLEQDIQNLQKAIESEEKLPPDEVINRGRVPVSAPDSEPQGQSGATTETKTITSSTPPLSERSTARSEGDLVAEMDGINAELGVLDQLTDVVDKARFLVTRHSDAMTEALGHWILYFDRDESTKHENANYAKKLRSDMAGPVEHRISRLRDRLHFAQMESETLKKQKVDRDPIRIAIYGVMTGVVEVKYGEKLTVSDAILRCGRSESADLRRVVVHRQKADKTNAFIRVDVDRILKLGDRSGDLELQRGDRIEVRAMGLF
jgi:hypothetical protein